MNHDLMPHVALALVSVFVIVWLGAWAHNAWHGMWGPKPVDVKLMRTAIAAVATVVLFGANYWWLRRRLG